MSNCTTPEEEVDYEATLRKLRRVKALVDARNSLIEFTKVTMPHPQDPEDPTLSRYEVLPHHELIAKKLEEVEQGKCLRLIITTPPRHGKSELASKRFPAWYLGRRPYDQVIQATYNEDFAKDFGRAVRDIMKLQQYESIFPLAKLATGSKSAERLQTEAGGVAAFVGVGGSITGRGADLLIIDDPIKDVEDAESRLSRDKKWEWFRSVARTRLMGDSARIIIIMTRWHEDDLVGRLTDPNNDHYEAETAKRWELLHIPAIAEDDDILGREKGEALWPDRYSIEFLEEARAGNERGFSALYQGRPSPEDGDYFRKKWLKYYDADDLPPNLRYYATSDHAISKKSYTDYTVLMPFGVAENDDIYILPRVVWRKLDSHQQVEEMLGLMREYALMTWWAENGQIGQAIGPFLKKRMDEERLYCFIDPITPSADKQTRAQSIRARVSMGKVYFPKFCEWTQRAEDEMLKFPAGSHDDFVDALSLIGLGLTKQFGASRPSKPTDAPKVGTLGWLKQSTKEREDREARINLSRRRCMR